MCTRIYIYNINYYTMSFPVFRVIVVVILLSTLQTAITQVEIEQAETECPSGSNRRGNFCYFISREETTYEKAKQFCNNNGGTLATIKDYETQVFLQSLRMRKFLHNYWFGLHDLHGEGNWIHEDDTKLLNYTNWGKGEPNSYAGDQDCASLRMLKDLTWDDEFCTSEFLYICEVPESKCTTNSTKLGNICYVTSHEFTSYYEANKKCKALGGELALIKSKKIDDFIRKLVFNDEFWLTMTEKQIKEVYGGMVFKFTWFPGSWIGLQYKNDTWMHDDNTTAYYPRWTDEELSEKYCVTLGSAQNPYNCGTKYSKGKKNYNTDDIEKCYAYSKKWKPVDCSESHNYICQYPADVKNIDIYNYQTEKYEALEYGKNTVSAIYFGVGTLITIILSCIVIGVLLTVLTFFVYILKRNRGINTYANLRNVLWRPEAEAEVNILEEESA